MVVINSKRNSFFSMKLSLLIYKIKCFKQLKYISTNLWVYRTFLQKKKKFIEVISLFKKLNVLNNQNVFQPLYEFMRGS